LATAATLSPLIMGTGGYVYASRVEPGWLQVVPLSVRLPRLDPAFDGFRLAHISDLHADDAWMTEERLLSAMEVVNAQQVELVVITGDFVTSLIRRPIQAALTNALRRLTPPALAVLGNHDHWVSAAGVRTILQDAGVMELRNAVHSLRRGAAQLHLAGVDDTWQRQDRLDMVNAALPAAGAAILLAHEPDYADTSAATGRFDLQLSGHSHGGQVHIPFVGMPVLPPFGRRYPSGLYHLMSPTGQPMMQYTNRGLGMVRPYVRFNCRPEVTVFTLRV
jgi:hypothetical protein